MNVSIPQYSYSPVLIFRLYCSDRLDWDAVRYSDRLTSRPTGRNEDKESEIQAAYPPPANASNALFSSPMIITDKHGVILGWYLPGLLTPFRQVGFLAGFKFLVNRTTCYISRKQFGMRQNIWKSS